MLERLGEVNGSVKQEVHARQVELITNICSGAAEAVQALEQTRPAALGAGAEILASGTQPSAEEGEAPITHKTALPTDHYLWVTPQ